MKTWVGLTIFATAVVGTVSTLSVNALMNTNTEPIVAEELAIEIEEKSTPQTEGEPVEEETKEEPLSKPETTPAPTPATQIKPTTTPKPSQAAQSKPETQHKQQATPTYEFDNRIEFERAYMGWCPQNVPSNAYHQLLSKSSALGYIDIDYSSYKSIDEAAIYAWSWYQGSRVNAKSDSSYFLTLYFKRMNEVIIGDNGWQYVNFIIQADPFTKTTIWKRSDGEEVSSLPKNVIQRMDEVALQIKNKMIQLDQQYQAKCGY